MKAVTYLITLLEPLLATGPGSDPNTEKSQDHIPGSVLRGAWASQFDAADAAFSRLFLTGQTRFHNAYPSMGAKRALPLPHCWKREKDPADPEDRRVYNWLDNQASAPKMTKNLPGNFFDMDGTAVQTIGVDWEIAVHNSRNRTAGRAMENDGALFRYQALARGQRFVGVIEFDEASDTDRFIEWLSGDEYLLLGGSHSAGYGLASVAVLPEVSPGGAARPAIEAGERFVLYLASDAILTDPLTGQPGAEISAVLAGALPEAGTITMHQAFSRTRWVAGFNNKWGLPLPQTWAYQMGSVWQLSAAQTISADSIRKLEQKGWGERQAEGFGQVLVNPAWLQLGQSLTYDQVKAELAPPPPGDDQFPALTARLLPQMNQRLAEQELDRRLQAVANDMGASLSRRRLSQSQLGRLRLRIRAAYDDDAGLKAFADYLQETKQRKSVDDQFRKVAIKQPVGGQKNFRAWMQELAANPDTIWQQIGLGEAASSWQLHEKQWQRPLLGDEPFTLTADHSRRYAARLIEAVCEQASRGGHS